MTTLYIGANHLPLYTNKLYGGNQHGNKKEQQKQDN